MTILCFILISSSIFYFNTSHYRPEYAIVIIGIFIGIISNRFYLVRMFRRELVFLLSMTVFALTSVVWQVMFVGETFIGRDLMIVLMLAYYGCIIAFVGMAFGQSINYRRVWASCVLLSGAIIVISVFQYFNFFNINAFFLPQSKSSELLMKGFSWKRTVGTIGNPNYWGFLISVALALFTYEVFWRGRFIWLPFLFCLFFSLILTGSRSALICWLLGTLIGGIIVAVITREMPKIKLTVAAILVTAIILCGFEISSYYENKDRYSSKAVSSLIMRFDMWKKAWKTTSKNFGTILLGQGPRKGAGKLQWADNSYVKIYRDYGIVNLFLYFGFLRVLIMQAIWCVRVQSGNGRAWAIVLLFVLTQLIIFDLAADTWFFVRVSTIVLTLYSFVNTRAITLGASNFS